jgi:hypothetical protein
MTPNTMNLIMTGKVCPYCGKDTNFIDSAMVYGKSMGMMYACMPCGAWVGVHKGSDVALGRLADSELRKAKREAHFYFDQISKTNLINEIWEEPFNGSNRSKAYVWLAKQLCMKEEHCHIGMMDPYKCKEVVEVCKPYCKQIL